jgi:ribulose-phosphate 3-epimerase
MLGRGVLISPSLLACDFGKLKDEVQLVQEAGADWLHVDVMDGHFVPNLTMGPVVVDAIRKASRVPLDIHLMLDEPEKYFKAFVDAGADYLTVHLEAESLKDAPQLLRTLDAIRKIGARAGLSIRPKTPAESMRPYLDATDLVLVMSVEPGFGGQAFIPEAIPKVRQLRSWYAGDISVDGGIDEESGKLMREAGANVLVAGTSIFRKKSYKGAIQALRGKK